MSGPTPMMLGSFAFEALGFGFNGLQRRVQTRRTARRQRLRNGLRLAGMGARTRIRG